jgi:anti-anti-sigma factor
MEWTEKQEGEWTVLKIIGVINFETAEELKSVFNDMLAQGVKNVRLNLKNVPIANSSGVSHILLFFKSLQQREGKLEIRGASKNLMEMFKLLEIQKLFPLYEEE